MGKRFMFAKYDLWVIAGLYFQPNTWYQLGQIMEFCQDQSLIYSCDVVSRRLNELVQSKLLMRRTVGGDYQYCLALEQLPLPDFE